MLGNLVMQVPMWYTVCGRGVMVCQKTLGQEHW